jgi:hypothetical protein
MRIKTAKETRKMLVRNTQNVGGDDHRGADHGVDGERKLMRLLRIPRARKLIVGLLAVLALTTAFASAALAGTGVGATFNLGKTNMVNALSILTGSANDAMLRIVNNDVGASATALDLQVAAGKPPLRVNSPTKVANLTADMLDGRDSTDFVQGPGEADHGESAMPPGSSLTNFFNTQDPNLGISYSCPSTLSQNGTLRIQNNGSAEVNLFSDNGSGNPSYQQLAPGASFDQGANAGGELITFGVHNFNGAHRVTTIEVFTVNRGSLNNCHAHAQALITR